MKNLNEGWPRGTHAKRPEGREIGKIFSPKRLQKYQILQSVYSSLPPQPSVLADPSPKIYQDFCPYTAAHTYLPSQRWVRNPLVRPRSEFMIPTAPASPIKFPLSLSCSSTEFPGRAFARAVAPETLDEISKEDVSHILWYRKKYLDEERQPPQPMRLSKFMMVAHSAQWR